MDKVIGLGDFGCAVAEQLTAYPEYRIYKINSTIDERGSLSIGEYSTIDQYENTLDTDEVSIYLRSIKPEDEVLFIVEGGTPISAATLKILLVSKPAVDKLVGDVSIQEYEKSISYFVAYTIAMYNYFNHTDSVLSNTISPPKIARVTALGVSSLEEASQDINFLFPLDEIKDIHFFYGIPAEDMADDTSLIKRIKSHVKTYKGDEISTSFSVYETTLGDPMVLCIAYSGKIQAFAS